MALLVRCIFVTTSNILSSYGIVSVFVKCLVDPPHPSVAQSNENQYQISHRLQHLGMVGRLFDVHTIGGRGVYRIYKRGFPSVGCIHMFRV